MRFCRGTGFCSTPLPHRLELYREGVRPWAGRQASEGRAHQAGTWVRDSGLQGALSAGGQGNRLRSDKEHGPTGWPADNGSGHEGKGLEDGRTVQGTEWPCWKKEERNDGTQAYGTKCTTQCERKHKGWNKKV